MVDRTTRERALSTKVAAMDCHRHVKCRCETVVSSRRLARWNESAGSRILRCWASEGGVLLMRQSCGNERAMSQRRSVRPACSRAMGRTSLMGSGAWPTMSTGSRGRDSIAPVAAATDHSSKLSGPPALRLARAPGVDNLPNENTTIRRRLFLTECSNIEYRRRRWPDRGRSTATRCWIAR